MKTIQKMVLVIALIITTSVSMGQTPPHPNGGSDPGSTSTPVGGGAPVGGGLLILLALGLGYGTRKVYDLRRKALE